MIFKEVNTFISIVSSAFNNLPINKWRRDFLIEIFMLYLVIPGRINFKQMSRYSHYCEQRFRYLNVKEIKAEDPQTYSQSDIQPIQLQAYIKTLKEKDFTTENVMQTAKGWKVAKVHTVTIWHWDSKEEKAYKRTLVITVYEKTKFSLSNGDIEEYTNKEWAYFQCSRYWVERCFDDCKNELGMSGYQVTG